MELPGSAANRDRDYVQRPQLVGGLRAQAGLRICQEPVNLLVPKPPYQLRPLDVITVTVRGTPQEIPIDGSFPIETNGTILLGFDYGSVAVAGKTEDEAREAILKHARGILKEEPEVLVKISETASEQQIAGQHLVQLDGKVNLGSHGRVRIVGMTIEEAKETIEAHLAQFFLDPEIALDIFAFNSKSYYIITQGAGLGRQGRVASNHGETKPSWMQSPRLEA